MSLATKRTKALAGAIAGAVLLLTLAAAALALGGDAGPPAAIGSSAAAAAAEPPAPEPQAGTTSLPAPFAAPATTTPTTSAPTTATAPSTTPTTAKKATPSTTRATAAPTTAAPATTVAPAKLPPGQRVEYTTATVQAAITALHQRIPLFAPTDPQLRTFADAVCTSFDQGQTKAQVQATVRDAVSRIQGASLSEADAEFAVRTVTQLRCPGYLA